MCSKISTSLSNSSGHGKQRSLIESSSSGSANNEFGDWRSSCDSSDKPRVSSDSEMQTTRKSVALVVRSSQLELR